MRLWAVDLNWSSFSFSQSSSNVIYLSQQCLLINCTISFARATDIFLLKINRRIYDLFAGINRNRIQYVCVYLVVYIEDLLRNTLRRGLTDAAFHENPARICWLFTKGESDCHLREIMHPAESSPRIYIFDGRRVYERRMSYIYAPLIFASRESRAENLANAASRACRAVDSTRSYPSHVSTSMG